MYQGHALKQQSAQDRQRHNRARVEGSRAGYEAVIAYVLRWPNAYYEAPKTTITEMEEEAWEDGRHSYWWRQGYRAGLELARVDLREWEYDADVEAALTAMGVEL